MYYFLQFQFISITLENETKKYFVFDKKKSCELKLIHLIYQIVQISKLVFFSSIPDLAIDEIALSKPTIKNDSKKKIIYNNCTIKNDYPMVELERGKIDIRFCRFCVDSVVKLEMYKTSTHDLQQTTY